MIWVDLSYSGAVNVSNAMRGCISFFNCIPYIQIMPLIKENGSLVLYPNRGRIIVIALLSIIFGFTLFFISFEVVGLLGAFAGLLYALYLYRQPSIVYRLNREAIEMVDTKTDDTQVIAVSDIEEMVAEPVRRNAKIVGYDILISTKTAQYRIPLGNYEISTASQKNASGSILEYYKQ